MKWNPKVSHSERIYLVPGLGGFLQTAFSINRCEENSDEFSSLHRIAYKCAILANLAIFQSLAFRFFSQKDE